MSLFLTCDLQVLLVASQITEGQQMLDIFHVLFFSEIAIFEAICATKATIWCDT